MPRKEEGRAMSQPFNLDAVVDEAIPEPFRFSWAGDDYELPAILALPLDRQLEIISAIEGLDAAKFDPTEFTDLLRLIMGEDLLARLSSKRAFSALALMRLVEAWVKHQGGELGKSPASSDSSATTGLPSKQISRFAQDPQTSLNGSAEG